MTEITAESVKLKCRLSFGNLLMLIIVMIWVNQKSNLVFVIFFSFFIWTVSPHMGPILGAPRVMIFYDWVNLTYLLLTFKQSSQFSGPPPSLAICNAIKFLIHWPSIDYYNEVSMVVYSANQRAYQTGSNQSESKNWHFTSVIWLRLISVIGY